jgi:crotonobetainyl-CoA:carnitine CoA-transferase CaiB-like acyl-CoA transferase
VVAERSSRIGASADSNGGGVEPGACEGSFLRGLRVIEIADELGEYCGKVLAGLGADVIKIEPPGGEATRGYGPFLDDREHPNRSLHFWHYNFGKRSVVLDLDNATGRSRLTELLRSADVLLETRPTAYWSQRGLSLDDLMASNPTLVHGRITPFGDDGPWSGYRGSDLIHLALGGVMMNCGYDADTTGVYDTPPIAPQMWQSYHIAGEVAAIQIVAAMNYRLETGRGQRIAVSVHDAVSKTTETDLPDWVYARQPHGRRTCRHSFAVAGTGDRERDQGMSAYVPSLARTKDGRWILPYSTYLSGFDVPFQNTVDTLAKYDAAEDLDDERYGDDSYVRRPETLRHVESVISRFIGSTKYDRHVWQDAQNNGLAWAPVRKPEENLEDEHWSVRNAFLKVEHPELGRSFVQVGGKWVAPDLPWRTGPRAPMLGEHTAEVLNSVGRSGEPYRSTKSSQAIPPGRTSLPKSKHGKPFALSGLRIIDLSWLLASGGAGRFFTAHGAEVIKVEHRSRVDGMRFGRGVPPPGGREERERATTPLVTNNGGSLNRSGSFMEINAGKRSLSLNLKSVRGKELLCDLIRNADMVIEGFSPGTMDRMGFGYSRLKEINPGIIYVQQSGMGQMGTLGRMRTFGPTAQAFSGLSEMSGLPDPYPPAGIGFSYLDWFGAYQMALAMMAALYRRRTTGQGCHIDSSQVEVGLYLTGSAILDKTANGRSWERYGNASPYKKAAPHGVFPTEGHDRWIAIAAFTQQQWEATADVLGVPSACFDERFLTLDLRSDNDCQLADLLAERTKSWEAHALMAALQQRGVPAGVCQTAKDRCERDPQLEHDGWLVELEQSEIGTWPVKEVPGQMSETPPYIGGFLDRHGPSYGEDTDYVMSTILGLTAEEIEQLRVDGVL